MRKWWWGLSDKARAIWKAVIFIVITFVIIVGVIALICGFIGIAAKVVIYIIVGIIILIIFGAATNFR